MSELSLERGIEALREEIDAPVAAFFSSCVHCGLCAQACPFYVETGDPKYTPILKVEAPAPVGSRSSPCGASIKGMIGLSKKITDEMLAEWEPCSTTPAPCARAAPWSARWATTSRPWSARPARAWSPPVTPRRD